MGMSDIVVDGIPLNPINIFSIGKLETNMDRLFEGWSTNIHEWKLKQPSAQFVVKGPADCYEPIFRTVPMPERVQNQFRARIEGASLGIFDRDGKRERLRRGIASWLAVDDELSKAFVGLLNDLAPIRHQAELDNRAAWAGVPMVRYPEDLMVEVPAGTMMRMRVMPPEEVERASTID